MNQRDELEEKHFPQGGVSQRKLDLMWRLSYQAMWEAAHGGGVSSNDDCARILTQTYDELASLAKPDEVDLQQILLRERGLL